MKHIMDNLTAKIQSNKYYPWIVWSLCASFFFAEYLVRLEPSITKQQLMQAFHLNATGFGTMSAFFTFSYVAMQIPVGTLIDRFGAHKLMVLNSIGCAVGCFLFAISQSLWLAETGRLISGIGSAFAFVGTLRLATNWFPPHKIGLIAGMTQAAGMLGAAVGEGPFAVIVSALGWRETMWLIGGIILAIGLLILVLVRDKPGKDGTSAVDVESGPSLWHCLKEVLKNPQSWYNGIFVGLLYAPTASFAELWGVPFLSETYKISTELAAGGISAIFFGWALGGPLTGWISDKQGKRKPTMMASSLLSLVLITSVIYIPNIPILLLFIILFFYGVANTGVATSYALSSEINIREVSGTSIAFANMSSVIIGSLFQPLIGSILDTMWDGKLINGAPIYSINAYQNAMKLLPVCLLLSFFMSFLVKETYCRGRK
ncbi:MAG: MFS transporter [Pseudomonadota bacterium]|nr:MFS transporter [Pseudomonadota bacterium]